MSGYRVGKDKVLYVYTNVITKEEEKIIGFYIDKGYTLVSREKNLKRNNNTGFSKEFISAKKVELTEWIKANIKEKEERNNYLKSFDNDNFMKAKSVLGKVYGKNYPDLPEE